jgi:4'-phosphopantetheinyl transferase
MSIQLRRADAIADERWPLALPKGEIHLWLADYEQSNPPQLQDAYRQLLNSEERQQEPRFYFARDRRRYLLTRALVRTVLSRYAPVSPQDWIFSNNAYGRPQIANAEAMDLNLSFNISHTHSLIVLGIANGRALGVDVENIAARKAPIAVADHYFAPAEVSALAATPSEQQQYRFFEYWTFKESYIKARGMGLSLPLDKFGFHFPHRAAVAIEIHPELADEPARWQFWQFQPAPEYLVAICAERLQGADTRLSVRQVVPLQNDKIFATTLLRTSRMT